MRFRLTPLGFALLTSSCQLISGLSSVDVGEGGSSSSSVQTTASGTSTGTTTVSTGEGAGGMGARCLDYCVDIRAKCVGAELQFPNTDICGAFCAFLDGPRLDCRMAALAKNGPGDCARAGPAGDTCDDHCAQCGINASYFCGDPGSACTNCATTDYASFSWNGCADGGVPPDHCAIYLFALLMTYPAGDNCTTLLAGSCPAASLCDGPP